MNYTRNQEEMDTYPLLPKELRDEIWELATNIRKERPGIHFFVMRWSTDQPQTEHPSDKIIIDWFIKQCHVPDELRLIEQLKELTILKGRPPNWPADHNPSAYAIDSGRWTACAESREAMERCLRREDVEDRSGTYLIKEGEEQKITILPHDLLCFQSDHWPSLGLYLEYMSFLMVNLGDRDLDNIAVEFDPSWSSRRGSAYDTLLSAPYSMDGLFFIDYRIRRRRERIPRTSEIMDRKVFSGNGCRLVEVRICDGEEWHFADGSPLDPRPKAHNPPVDTTISADSNPFIFSYELYCSSQWTDFEVPKEWECVEEWWETEMQQCWEDGKMAKLYVLAFETYDEA